ncbi:MAG: delta(1)-pyrroline-2-carboxylate reductase family protein [Burkholderiaceae bacterium]
MQIFDARRTAQLLPYDRLVPAIAQMMRERAQGGVTAPERQTVPAGDGGVLLSMPAVAGDLGVVKLITVHPGNAARGMPAIQGEVIVFDANTGRRRLLLDGPTVTARRTAAVTLLGIRTLLPATPASALLIGTGVQAAAHADALGAFCGIRRFVVAGRDVGDAKMFCTDFLQSRTGCVAVAAAADEIADAASEADVVIALTTSRSPVVPATLPPRTLAVGVGAFRPDMAELPGELLRSRPIVVDDLAGARHEAGDLLQAGIDWSAVTELGTILAGDVPAPEGAAVLKTVGQAAWDLAAARVAVEAAGTAGA